MKKARISGKTKMTPIKLQRNEGKGPEQDLTIYELKISIPKKPSKRWFKRAQKPIPSENATV